MSGRPGGCDPRLIFELAEGALEPARRRRALAHLESCPLCRARYERERRLSERLRLASPPATGSVRREVAMELPTRTAAVRAAWVVLCLALLLADGAALGLAGANPLAFASGLLGLFWAVASGLATAGRVLVEAAGGVLLAALAAGALADLLVAAVVVSARRRARQA
ncbi:hypothetical protein Rxyl_0864 [Rubrobacter xylanophilus DSM 9941]|uniref:Zinc-finger domain-containing protein n=1 Tax=Rubrobacter xylanophilus (strain DSM 9941 / JCM 11954 / NBRC 16129 / PRD-1) TaxID=266117 RepID=Q1AXP7_RUBXD|nr:zf-HC2 domain-containing protein [Rubrobacter xylanophilus]ABG03831.1 hypothetical protein Rxyl_0864 [Rubrobacter xylanophilus DSM 9941]